MASSREHAVALGGLLAEHRGIDVTLLDVAVHSGWTDWFVIATATSVAHLRGLARFAEEYVHAERLPWRGSPSISDDEEWVLLDLGDVVVHLMSASARAFYELERLWFQAEAVKVAPPVPGSSSSPEVSDPPAS